MKTGVIAIAMLALCGFAHASIITGTYTGTITGGYDSGPNGTNDDAELFGGGNLYGLTITLTFSYNTDALYADAVFDSQNGDTYSDEADDSAVTVSIAIGANDYSLTNSNTDSLAVVHVSTDSLGFLVDDSPTPTGSFQSIDMTLVSTLNLPLGDLGNQAAVDAFMHNLTGAQTYITYSEDVGYDLLTVSPTPEPTTWISLALGLGGFALLKFPCRVNVRDIYQQR